MKRLPREANPVGPLADPFAAVPLIAEGVEAREDSRGTLQLRMTVPPGTGLRGLLARRFGLLRPVRVNLDANGTLFWKQIDGRRTLAEIESILRNKMGLKPKDSEEATVLFTKMLMLRRLIYLKVPDEQGRRP